MSTPVKVTDRFGCTVKDTASILVDTVVVGVAYNDTTISTCNSIDLVAIQVQGRDTLDYVWDEGGNSPWQ